MPERSGHALDISRPLVPALPGEVHVALTTDLAIDHVITDLVLHAVRCVEDRGTFHLALSGERALAPLLDRLMYDPDCRRLPWHRTHLWLVHDRGDLGVGGSASRRLDETIVGHSGIPASQVHLPGGCDVDAAEACEHDLRASLEDGRLDHVLLGTGAGGTVVGLAAGSPLLGASRLVGHDPDAGLTMTLPLINTARVVQVLVTGEASRATVHRIAERGDPPEVLPITGIDPAAGELHWYLDVGASGEVRGD